MARGTVKAWNEEEGWGVLTSPQVPGDVWAHFAHLRRQAGYRSLRPGQAVTFDYFEQPGGQDGFVYVARNVGEIDAPDEPTAPTP